MLSVILSSSIKSFQFRSVAFIVNGLVVLLGTNFQSSLYVFGMD